MIRIGIALAVVCAACSSRPETDAGTPDAGPADAGSVVAPLGAWLEADGLHASVLSQHATRIELSVFTGASDTDAALKVDLGRGAGARWSVVVPSAALPQGTLYYGYRAWGPNVDAGVAVDSNGNRFDPSRLLIDPWARELSHDPFPARGPVKALVLTERTFDTGARPSRAFQDDVVYEVHLRGLTMNDPDVPAACRGTYAGAAAKAQYLKELGITAIELLPIAETQNDGNDVNPNSASGDNYWGYSTLAFSAPDRRYACDKSPGGPTRELAAMVKAFHDAGLKVFLDVVYNHTSEGSGGLQSLRLLDNASYYELQTDKTRYVENTGVGANVNAANPLAQELIIGSLKHWHETLGVDGFRFDLASVLGNSCTQACFAYEKNGFLARIARELPSAVLIAEPWGIGTGTYQLGNFPDGWGEWNDTFRDGVRRVQNKLGVDAVAPGTVRELWSGSLAKFDGARHWTVNYVVSHDGFTLRDVYACNLKDNMQPWPYGPSNGGDDNNHSWDQGGDAAAQKAAVRTGLSVLLTARGVPMFTGGDELMRTQYCNNNPFNIDSVAMWVDWAGLRASNADVQAFARKLLAFRAAHPSLRTGARMWQRANGAEPDGAYLGDAANTFLAFHAGEVFVAWNWGTQPVNAVLPGGSNWALAGDSATGTFHDPGSEVAVSVSHPVAPRSVAVFVAR